LSPEAAEKILIKSDNKRKSYIRYAFDQDWDNPKLYDIIINRDKLLPGTAAKMIIDAAQSGEIGACGLKASEAMGKLALLKKIEAELLRNNFNMNHLHIEIPEMDIVRIWGYILNVWGYTETPDEPGRLKKIVEQIPGVKKVEYDVSVMDMDGGC
jgi:hypothetical protein